MKKIFVLDTNVILYDPNAIFKFDDNIVVIPIVVVEELDKFKKDLNEIGRNAREFARILDKFRQNGKLTKGVTLENGGMIKVELGVKSISRIPASLENGTPDNKMLATALYLKEKHENMTIVFVTKDINLRIKADSFGLRTEDYKSAVADFSEIYEGIKVIDVTKDKIDQLYQHGELDIEDSFLPNQFLVLKDREQGSQSALAKFDKKKNKIVGLTHLKQHVWGINPRNKEQTFALEMLLDDDIKLVTMTGMAGTGKTLLAIACGLYSSIDLGIYKKLLISRPIFPLGRDIGYLPGDLEEKLKPWMQPIFDNMELLLSTTEDRTKRIKKGYHELIELGMVEIEALTYIRGRSIPNQFLIIDEAQNLTPHEIKTIITRVGEGTKIVFTGDPYQIDNPYVDSLSNGLSYVVERFKEEEIAAHINLIKGERSLLAEKAAKIL